MGPTDNPTEHFVQVQRTLDTNYWGLKNVVNAFIPKLSDTARIVNMSSNYSMLRMIPGREIRNILGKPDLSEKDLDELMMEYQRRSTEFNDDFLNWVSQDVHTLYPKLPSMLTQGSF